MYDFFLSLKTSLWLQDTEQQSRRCSKTGNVYQSFSLMEFHHVYLIYELDIAIRSGHSLSVTNGWLYIGISPLLNLFVSDFFAIVLYLVVFMNIEIENGLCQFYLISVCLRIVVSNTYCVVFLFLFCFSSSCVPCVANFSRLSIFDYLFGVL